MTAPPPRAPRRVFVLDDDNESRELLTEVLRARGLLVDEFETAERALASVAEAPPAVVILDISLGAGISGYEAARRIQTLDTQPPVRLIAMTGHDRATVQKQGTTFDAIFTKPVDAEALIRTVREFL